jgi:putative FmdB family regulatory protein
VAIYRFACPRHGDFEEIRSIKAFTRELKCPECGRVSSLVIAPPGKHRVDFREGWNGGAGKNFATKRERDNWMREKNVEFA